MPVLHGVAIGGVMDKDRLTGVLRGLNAAGLEGVVLGHSFRPSSEGTFGESGESRPTYYPSGFKVDATYMGGQRLENFVAGNPQLAQLALTDVAVQKWGVSARVNAAPEGARSPRYVPVRIEYAMNEPVVLRMQADEKSTDVLAQIEGLDTEYKPYFLARVRGGHGEEGDTYFLAAQFKGSEEPPRNKLRFALYMGTPNLMERVPAEADDTHFRSVGRLTYQFQDSRGRDCVLSTPDYSGKRTYLNVNGKAQPGLETLSLQLRRI